MTSYIQANQCRLILKMQLYLYSWYRSSMVVSDNDGYSVVIEVSYIDNQIRKLISPVLNGVSVKTEVA